jgi:hypothetical protein
METVKRSVVVNSLPIGGAGRVFRAVTVYCMIL